MKILVLSPYYFPYINPRAHRWTSIAEQWAKEGHEVHLICSKNKDYLSKHQLNQVHVHRTGFNSLKEILYYFSKNVNKRGEAGQKKQNAGKKGAFMQWLNDKILRNIYFPDDAFMWYFPARKTAQKLLKTIDFDLLISSSVPFTTHLVALNLKKKYPNLKWIADTGDPFAFQPLHPLNNYFLYGKWNRKLERKVVENADFVSLTNEGAVYLYQKLFPAESENFVKIPPVLRFDIDNSKEDLPEKEGKKKQLGTKKIRVGYFGSFFKNIREPRPVLYYFDQLLQQYPERGKTLELHFYGNIFENFLQDFAAFPRLKNIIIFHGMISSQQVTEEMQKMNILLNVGNSTTFQLASKSVDYMLSGKAIINFISHDADTFNAFFKDYNYFAAFHDKNWKDDLVKLNVFLTTFSNKKIRKEQVQKMTVAFRVENIAKQYLDLV